VDSVANWCQVDTRTGRLAVILEENYCFDAETYADELKFDEEAGFREDQRSELTSRAIWLPLSKFVCFGTEPLTCLSQPGQMGATVPIRWPRRRGDKA